MRFSVTDRGRGVSAFGMRTHYKARRHENRGPNYGIFVHPFVRDACTPAKMEWRLLLRRISGAARLRPSDSIAMTGRLGDDEETCILAAMIEDLMRRLRGYAEAGAGCEAVFFTVEFDGELAGEHVKELRRAVVHVALLGGARRHALFDHAESVGAMEVPAITHLLVNGAGPGVVLGIVGADGHLFTLALRN